MQKIILPLKIFFFNIPENIVACLNENNHKILEAFINRSCYTLDCSDNWEKNQKKLVNKTDICFDIYNNSILYKYEYQGLYYEYYINENAKKNKTISYCKCDDENCISCPND